MMLERAAWESGDVRIVCASLNEVHHYDLSVVG
jgi:hypothetical protein